MYLTPKNWDRFQHYRHRSPPWIKLHRGLLDDRAFMLLPLAGKALAPMLWLLASESDDGMIDADVDDLMFRLRVTEKTVIEGVRALVDAGLFDDASKVLAPASKVLAPASKVLAFPSVSLSVSVSVPLQRFEEFWNAYDKKRSRPTAEKAWSKICPDDALCDRIVGAARSYAEATPDKQFRKDPATWLNQECWGDELVPVTRGQASNHTSKTISTDFGGDPIQDL